MDHVHRVVQGYPSDSVAAVLLTGLEQLAQNVVVLALAGVALFGAASYAGVAAAASYVLAWLAASVYLEQPLLFIIASSYTHYIVYLYTLQTCRGSGPGRPRTSRAFFDRFRRSSVLLRWVSWSHLLLRAWEALQGPRDTPLHAAAACMFVGGNALAFLAYRALGDEGTFFGYEMGFVVGSGPVTTFPFTYVPHPMILGDVTALLGLYIIPGFADHNAWLVPLHVIAYGAVLVHEMMISRSPFHDNPSGSSSSSSKQHDH